MRTRGEGRRRLSVIAAATAVAVTALGLGSAAGQGVGGTVNFTIGPKGFDGVIKASERRCERARDVTLLYSNGGAAFAKVGTDRTDAAGEWRIDAQPFPGKYSARVKRLVTDEFSCRALRVTKAFFP
jgi:hypothetical protein